MSPFNKTTISFIHDLLYKHDYLKADEAAENELLDDNTTFSNNLIKDIGGRNFMVYHFHGFDPKVEGNDWETLYLVFDIEGGEYKLRGIAQNYYSI